MKISSRTQSYLLIAILIVAAILRFNQINQPFIDATSWRQASTAMMADNFYRRNWNIFYPQISWDGPGPSYNGREFQTVSYLAALLYVVVGQHDWVGRSVAVIFGLWGIFALYKLISCVWDQEHALMGAAVMALLPGSIYIEREFLPDPAMVALVTTSCWLLVAYCKTERLRYLLLASLIGMWGFLTKITGLIVGFPMIYAMFAIVGYKRILQPKKFLTIGIGVIFTLTPVIAYYLWARHLGLNYPPYHFAGENTGNWLWNSDLGDWWSQKYGIAKMYQIFKSWLWTKPVIVLVLFGLFHLPLQLKFNLKLRAERELEESNFPAPWLFHWWMLGGAVYYLIGVGHLLGNPYNFHIINPAAAALAGHAIIVIASFAHRIARSPAAIATILAILLIIGRSGHNNLWVMYYPWAEQGYKLGLALRQISKPGDLVLTITKDVGDPIAIYYSQRHGWNFYLPGDLWANVGDIDGKPPISQLDRYRAKGADWLAIINEQKNKIWKNNPLFVAHIKRTCELKQESVDGVIYRILSPEELSKIHKPR
ncbi:glycosyltransferase family 39 protein [Microseira wollei]|uniref:4-amino-4-deoxy-L-arabinose transferase and related glycosyltransferases of PMT family protein n=1 Tax=Microseira wollei NIES-4236 TaxID=2530354 RepID=A0AAV3X192_9CYAN|nr:glycosyltransferase family 39 protein [Microseira wollei]GET35673.1 4-amino-4-deoxy-L-arabinose transferase and related glycosyltransferases of PMT family protein [Microseira wollei NIES-4236]